MKENDDALVRAAVRGDCAAMGSALEGGADPNCRFAVEGAGTWTPLIAAASMGLSGAVALLLRRGARPDERDELGRTALHYAGIAWDGADAVRALLADGATASVVDRAGFSPLDAAAGAGNALTGTLLAAARAPCSPVHRAWVAESTPQQPDHGRGGR